MKSLVISTRKNHCNNKRPCANKSRVSPVAQLVKNPPAMQETPIQFWVGKIPWRRDRLPTPVFLASLVAQTVKNLPTTRETWVWSRVGKILWRRAWQNPLQEGVATHSSILAWRIHMDREAWQGYSLWGRKGSDTTEWLSTAQHRHK